MTTALTGFGVWRVVLVGLVFFLVVEAEKLAIRRKRNSPQSGAVPGSGTA